MQAQLADALRKQGFSLDGKPFRPHLTLARELRLSEPLDQRALAKLILPMEMRVDRITLMKSERVQGRLTYTPLYQRQLEEPV
ncbi:MAG: 2'-5' RNA ligase family protein [Oscillospiraceae bacterium]